MRGKEPLWYKEIKEVVTIKEEDRRIKDEYRIKINCKDKEEEIEENNPSQYMEE